MSLSLLETYSLVASEMRSEPPNRVGLQARRGGLVRRPANDLNRTLPTGILANRTPYPFPHPHGLLCKKELLVCVENALPAPCDELSTFFDLARVRDLRLFLCFGFCISVSQTVDGFLQPARLCSDGVWSFVLALKEFLQPASSERTAPQTDETAEVALSDPYEHLVDDLPARQPNLDVARDLDPTCGTSTRCHPRRPIHSTTAQKKEPDQHNLLSRVSKEMFEKKWP